MPAAPFVFIAGPDDFLVGRVGRERFEALAAGADEFSREVVNGFAANVDEVTAAVNRFRDAVQTVPMFGGRRVVWLKDVNFLADTVTGRAEGTLGQVEALQEILAKVDPAEVAVLVTAAPVDRRRSFPKWCEAHGDFVLVGGDGDGAGEALAAVALGAAREAGAEFADGALELLLVKVGANTRFLTEEARKLATHAGDGPITEAHVAELTPNVAEGDFFEAADRFFAGDLPGTLAALRRHFFTGGDARPILAALQNRNRLLLQARVLMDAGDLRAPSERFGFDKSSWSRAQADYAGLFGGDTEKSAFNFFTQNAWYAGKLVNTARMPPVRRLVENQLEFVRAFEGIVARPGEQEAVLRDMAVRCLAG